jgi:mRNA-degrading endonuclease RelE of RelBE toxin-antitoxin system
MEIDLLPGAIGDLTKLRDADPDALAAIIAFLQEAAAETDDNLIDKCTTKGNVEIGANRVNVKPWAAARRGPDNLFRFRILDTPATVYRVVYGYDWRKRRIGALAVVHKDNFDYEITGDLANRIYNDWLSATDGFST